jgi:hypothetical protein
VSWNQAHAPAHSSMTQRRHPFSQTGKKLGCSIVITPFVTGQEVSRSPQEGQSDRDWLSRGLEGLIM